MRLANPIRLSYNPSVDLYCRRMYVRIESGDSEITQTRSGGRIIEPSFRPTLESMAKRPDLLLDDGAQTLRTSLVF